VIGPPWLAHVASAEALVAVERLADREVRPVDYGNIAACTYCQPQVASVGLTQQAAREAGHELKVGKFPFRALGKAVAAGEIEGFVKMIYDARDGELLGGHIIGANATELIAEVATARTLGATHREIIDTIHPHPTMSEAVMEASALAWGESVNY
jgi:dihydrolipoamide dehydrogenase